MFQTLCMFEGVVELQLDEKVQRLRKRLLGKTAKAVPHERLLLEAKRRLIYTRANLDEIAYDLGFQDPGYFSRFFKRATGVTAGRFRSENNFDTTPESAPKI